MAVTTTANKLLTDPPTGEIEEIEDLIDMQFRSFKNFDTLISAPSDHHFLNTQPDNTPAAFVCIKNFRYPITRAAPSPSDDLARKDRIRHELELLKTNLPNSIFVRTYSTRPDLIRAAIIGLNNNNNPYGYGLFFFDIMLPPQYPAKPPVVHHHFYGVSLVAKMLNRVGSGRIISCLGEEEEDEFGWDPERSSVVDVLGFIQRRVVGRGEEMKGERCNEVFMLSHRAMAATLKEPPRGFEEFVKGYFRKFSHLILMQLKGHLEDEGFRKSSGVGQGFMGKLTFHQLVKEFEDNGSYCRHILCAN